ncbi:hypothetical protein Goshw_021946 [Gossypium schwendimanii]|uniref:Uncharacterized protein n=1 Tax=Gossypium schwendimanii TaxID=34291 RepID=A0A7J9MJ96_GOSSC|nr:hypothetical protein [Gossypium schwendimanii]
MCLTSQRDSVQELLDSLERVNNGSDNGFEHKNRGARGRASFVSSSHEERSVKCSTQLRGCSEVERVCGDKVSMQCGKFLRGRTSDKVTRDNATGHSGGICSRVQGTHTPSFRCDQEISIAYFSEWFEVVGQKIGGTKRCPKAVRSHDGSRVHGQAWSRERQAWVFQVRGKGHM